MIRILTLSTFTEKGLPPLNREFIHVSIEVEEVRVVQIETNLLPGFPYYEHILERVTTNQQGEVQSQFENLGMSLTPLSHEQLLAYELYIVNKPRLIERIVS